MSTRSDREVALEAEVAELHKRLVRHTEVVAEQVEAYKATAFEQLTEALARLAEVSENSVSRASHEAALAIEVEVDRADERERIAAWHDEQRHQAHLSAAEPDSERDFLYGQASAHEDSASFIRSTRPARSPSSKPSEPGEGA